MKNKKKQKTQIKILIMITVLILVIAVLALLLLGKKEEEVPHTTPKADIIDTKKDGVLNLSGFGIFFSDFSGELRSSEIANKLDEVTTKKIVRIYDMIKDYKESSELETFYNNNAASLKKMVGIENAKDFVNFGKKLQERDLNYNTWDRLDVQTDTFTDSSDKEGYAYAEYIVKYQDGSTITFTLYVAKSSSLDPQYIINIK